MRSIYFEQYVPGHSKCLEVVLGRNPEHPELPCCTSTTLYSDDTRRTGRHLQDHPHSTPVDPTTRLCHHRPAGYQIQDEHLAMAFHGFSLQGLHVLRCISKSCRGNRAATPSRRCISSAPPQAVARGLYDDGHPRRIPHHPLVGPSSMVQHNSTTSTSNHQMVVGTSSSTTKTIRCYNYSTSSTTPTWTTGRSTFPSTTHEHSEGWTGSNS